MTREEAIGWLKIIDETVFGKEASNAIYMAIEELKQPERKKGKWSEKGVYIFECSICGEHVKEPLNYCPNCGAKMEGEE